MPRYVEKWLQIGLSCEPCDLPRAARAVRQCYRAAGLEPPKQILHARSPVEAEAMYSQIENVGAVFVRAFMECESET